jgi:hypothetical protein
MYSLPRSSPAAVTQSVKVRKTRVDLSSAGPFRLLVGATPCVMVNIAGFRGIDRLESCARISDLLLFKVPSGKGCFAFLSVIVIVCWGFLSTRMLDFLAVKSTCFLSKIAFFCIRCCICRLSSKLWCSESSWSSASIMRPKSS